MLSDLHGVAKVIELDEDSAELLLDFALEDDSAELLLDLVLLLDTLVSPSLDFGVTLEEDSSPEGWVAEPLSSSPQAISIAALTRRLNQRERIFPPFIRFKYKKKQFKGNSK